MERHGWYSHGFDNFPFLILDFAFSSKNVTDVDNNRQIKNDRFVINSSKLYREFDAFAEVGITTPQLLYGLTFLLRTLFTHECFATRRWKLFCGCER